MSDEYLVNNSWNLETMIKKALGETQGVLQNKLLISELEQIICFLLPSNFPTKTLPMHPICIVIQWENARTEINDESRGLKGKKKQVHTYIVEFLQKLFLWFTCQVLFLALIILTLQQSRSDSLMYKVTKYEFEQQIVLCQKVCLRFEK